MARLWNKGENTNQLVLEFCVGNDNELDERLVAYDIVASIAHATMLKEEGWLSESDLSDICRGLKSIGDAHERGEWTISVSDEDVHTALENRLTDLIGDAGARIHLGRSRNDQVLVALRLYLKDEVQALIELANETAQQLNQLAERHPSQRIPGYTHLQKAMPSSVADWAHGFSSEIVDDAEGLRLSLRRADKNPLGSAAGYGVPELHLNRSRTAELLHFAEVHEPVTAVQLSRGKAEAAVVFELTLLMQDLGRLAAELCLFNSSEFGFVSLPKEFTTGSSIMPQKRNPDVFELIRGRSAQLSSDLTAILTTTAKMTSGYHRDLQLIKAPLFRAIDSTKLTLHITNVTLPGVAFVPEVLDRSMTGELEAASRAFALVKEEGIPFREAYLRIAKQQP
ncbi:MAG: argininosuccinate lyase [Planctomycetota bacterium]|jgi:argininosuccinate lyase